MSVANAPCLRMMTTLHAPRPSTAPLPMGYYGQGSQFPLMPNPNWMMTEREQMLQQQLLKERQQFEAWRASQAQPRPQPPISSSGLPFNVGDDVEITAGRSASAKRARPEDQVTDKAKHARSASTSRRSPFPMRDYCRGLAQPQGYLRPVLNGLSIHLLLLRTFKTDMTSMLSDMLQSSLIKFASQFNPSSGGQGESVCTQNVASVPTVDVASDCEDIPLGPEDQSEGEIVDSEGDPADAGIPISDPHISLKMTEEEQRDYDAFSLASVSVRKRPWRAQEDLSVSKPQPQNISLTRQARPVTSQA